MSLPYVARLLCLAFASFFLIHLATALIVTIFAPAAIRAAERLSPRVAARSMLTLRMLPFGLAVSCVLGLCVPSYLWLEPEHIEENVGFVCLSLAILGAVICGMAIGRAGFAAVRSLLFARRCRRLGREIPLSGTYPPALVIDSSRPFLALTGLLRARVVMSEGIFHALPEEELSVVMSHERAHEASRDNVKRLLNSLAPGILPLLNGGGNLERAWINFAEYAADEEAAGGDAGRSLALASALVRLARFGTAPLVSPIPISFLGEGSDLSARVNRLLAGPPHSESPHRISWQKAAMALILAGCLAAIVFRLATLEFVQSILEQLI